jgi:hypothetical protein
MTATEETDTMTDSTAPERRARRRVPITPMDQRFETGFTKADADALVAYCTAHGVKPAAFIREATLAALKRRTGAR